MKSLLLSPLSHQERLPATDLENSMLVPITEDSSATDTIQLRLERGHHRVATTLLGAHLQQLGMQLGLVEQKMESRRNGLENRFCMT